MGRLHYVEVYGGRGKGGESVARERRDDQVEGEGGGG